MFPIIFNKQKLLYFPAIALFILGWLFLLNLRSDHFIKHAPSDTGVYINTSTKFINKLPKNQYQLFLQWLEKNSQFNANQWQEAFKMPREISFFSLNGELFGIIKKNKATLSLAQTLLKSYVTLEEVVIFPKIKLDDKSLAKTAWFNKTRRKINFSPLNAYVKDIAEIKTPMPALASNSPISILGKLSSGKIKLTIFGDVGQDRGEKIRGQKFISDNTKLFIRDISFSPIKEEANFGKGNLVFQLLKSINGPIELRLFDSSFVLFAQKRFNSIEQLTMNISLILANIYPREKTKLLPDNTLAIHFLADPEKWEFSKEVVEKNQIKYKLQKPKQNIDIEVGEAGNLLTVTNNKSQNETGINNIKVNRILNSCSIFGNGIVFYQYENFDKDILNITIVNINKNKIRFCIN